MSFLTQDTTRPGQKSDGTPSASAVPALPPPSETLQDEPIIFDRYCPAGLH